MQLFAGGKDTISIALFYVATKWGDNQCPGAVGFNWDTVVHSSYARETILHTQFILFWATYRALAQPRKPRKDQNERKVPSGITHKIQITLLK